MLLVTLVATGIIVVLFMLGNAAVAAAREKRIYEKYGRTALADKLVSRTIWVGETVQQLRDSLGEPHDTDQKVLKTKSKEIWKYQYRGANRYGLAVSAPDWLSALRSKGWQQIGIFKSLNIEIP